MPNRRYWAIDFKNWNYK